MLLTIIINNIWETCIGQYRKFNSKFYINSEFSYIEIWFTDKNPKPLELKDKIKILLIIN